MLATGSGGLRILLVAAPRAIQLEIEDALRGSGAGHVLYWVSQAELAPERVEGLQPDVILVDDGFADVTLLIRVLAAAAPTKPIIYLAQQATPEGVSEAMLAGARSFLAKPVTPEALGRLLAQLEALLRASEQEAQRRRGRGRVVVFCAPKGGTGRTTLAVNVALGLAQEGEEGVVLLDADYAAPALDVVLNLLPERNITDLLPRLSQMDDALMQGVLMRHASGVRVLLAPEPDGLQRPITPVEVQQVLALLKRLYPWTIVDLGLPLDDTAFGFITAADLVVLSVLPEMVGLRNMRHLLDQLAERRVGPEKVWVVLNRSTMPGGVSVADIEKHLRTRVRFQIPDDQGLATSAVNRGIPVLAAHGRGALPRAFRQLSRELRDALADEDPETAEGARGRRRRGAAS